MTMNESTNSLKEPTKRTWLAVTVVEALFGVVYPLGVLIAVKMPVVDDRLLWARLGVLAAFIWLGVFVIVVGIPVAVFVVGRANGAFARERSTGKGALMRLVVGLLAGVLGAAILALASSAPFESAAPALMVTFGLVALGTYMLMPMALRFNGLRILARVIAVIPVGLVIFFGIKLLVEGS